MSSTERKSAGVEIYRSRSTDAATARRCRAVGLAPAFIIGALCCASITGCRDSTSPSVKGTSTANHDVAPKASSDDAGHVAQDDWFDVVELPGISAEYHNGRDGNRYTILETVGGGIAAFDFNGDGAIDLYAPGGGRISAAGDISGLTGRLLRNDTAWDFVDVTLAARLDTAFDYSHGAFVNDFDNDGFADLLVSCYGRTRLFHNCGDGTFADVTDDAGLPGDAWTTGAAWLDADGDGDSDLYLARYVQWDPATDTPCETGKDGARDVCPPQKYPPAEDALLMNNGAGQFDDGSSALGETRFSGRGLGAIAGEFTADGRTDCYVINDGTPNRLYVGIGNGRFAESGLSAGVATNEVGAAEGGMGCDVADYNADGLADLFVANFQMEDNSLYRGIGDGRFMHATVAAGLGGRGRTDVGFGVAVTDFSGDGRPDVFVGNGNVLYHADGFPHRQLPLLLLNTPEHRFRDVSTAGGEWFREPHAARGATVADFENDGAWDLAVVEQNAGLTLLRNRRSSENWISFRLIGTTGTRDAVGARVTVSPAAATSTFFVGSGRGYLSHFDDRILASVEPAATAATVVVHWPGGRTEKFGDLHTRTEHRLIEGRGRGTPDAE